MIIARWWPQAPSDDYPALPVLRFNKWGANPEGWHWQHVHAEWLVDGKPATPRQVIRRLRLIGDGGAIAVVEDYANFPDLIGRPEHNFGPEWADKCRSVYRAAYKSLRGILKMSAAEIDRIRIVLDHERWEHTAHDGEQLTRSHAEQAVEWSAWALREAGFGPSIGNYATLPVYHDPVGKPAQTFVDANVVPFLSGYVHDDMLYTSEEIESAFNVAKDDGGGFWYVHHGKADPVLIDKADAAGADMVLVWN